VKKLTLVLLCAALVVAGVRVYRSRPRVAPPVARPNIVLITIDTLRADRLNRGLTPTLDALSSGGTRFTHARTAVPLTLPSHTTILTGRLPAEHGVRENGQRVPESVPSLAQRLQDAGYQTAAFVGAYVLDRRFGLAKGFSHYDDHVDRQGGASVQLEAERNGAAVVDAATAWLETSSSPFLLWVHLYDPHAPYTPPAEYLARAAGNAYDGEVAYADAQVGRLVDRLRTRGLLETTVIVVAGDHGEGLGEHGEDTHGMLAYDGTLRVPLILAGPGVADRGVTAPVSLVDITPSLLRRAGVTPVIESGHQDLFADVAADRDVYAETVYPRVAGWHPLTVLVGAQWKLVMAGKPELYDLSVDPAESKNLAVDRASVAEGMQSRLRQFATQSASAPEPVSAEASERLRALGYVGTGSRAPSAPSGPNPAERMPAWSAFERALSQVNGGRAIQAVGPLRTLVDHDPDAPVFQSTYARALKDAGRPADAVVVYKAMVRRWPADAAVFHDLAVAAREAGDPGEASRAEQAALAIKSDDPAALNGAGLLAAESGKTADALAFFERATAGDPSNASYWTNLGNARRESGDIAGAEHAYRRALEAEPSHSDAANGIGVLLVQQQKAGEAVAWFERALRATPGLTEARLNLGIAYQESGRPDKAAAAYRELLATAPASAQRERQAATALLGRLGK
jgi:choline-sulfatase